MQWPRAWPQVSDFGLSSKSRAVGGQPGTPLWMAPELLRRVATTSTATDVYAFGVTLAEVFSRADPYAGSGLDAATVLAEVAAGPDPEAGRPEPRRPHVGAAVPPLFADIMRRCWAESPAARPSMAAITEEIRAGVAGADATASVTAALMAAKHSLKSDRALLHQVFPPAVAEALAAGRRVEPQQYDSVTCALPHHPPSRRVRRASHARPACAHCPAASSSRISPASPTSPPP